MNLKFHTNGLYIERADNIFTIGLSAKGQDDVGDVMFADLPKFKSKLAKGDTIIGVEGAKAVTDFTSPFDGKVVKVNEAVEDNPELLNSTNSSENWIVRLKDVDLELYNQLNDEPWPEGEGPSEED